MAMTHEAAGISMNALAVYVVTSTMAIGLPVYKATHDLFLAAVSKKSTIATGFVAMDS